MKKSELEQFKVEIKQDYERLLDLLARVLAVDNYLSFGDVNDSERLSIARGLTDKFVNHAVTILHLSRGIELTLPSFKFSLADFASIDVLTRVLLEACLTFHYVFYAPQTEEEKNCHYWVYKAAGIAERIATPASTEESERKQAEEIKELNKLHQRLEENAAFQRLTDKQKKRISKGEWRLKSWREIAIDAGFSKTMASKIYRYLSGSAHSSFLSVFLSVETQKSGTQEEAIIVSQAIANTVIANMVREYCGLFPKAHAIWSAHPETREFVEWWIHLDRTLDELIND